MRIEKARNRKGKTVRRLYTVYTRNAQEHKKEKKQYNFHKNIKQQNCFQN